MRKLSYLVWAAAQALSICAQTNTVVGAGYSSPVPLKLAPGQVVTLFVAGVGSSLTHPVYAPSGPLPVSLANISVTLRQGADRPAPIFQINPISTCVNPVTITGCGTIAAITIQVPYEMQTVCLLCERPETTTAQLLVSENGKAGALIDVTPLADQIHILTACEVTGASSYPVNFSGLPCSPLVTHADGTLVSAANPAASGEELVAYAFGLGPTNPGANTGQPVADPIPALTAIATDYNFHANSLAAKPGPASTSSVFAGLTAGYVGLYQINFVIPAVPPGTAVCAAPGAFGPGANVVQSNLTVSFGAALSFDGAGICVSPAD